MDAVRNSVSFEITSDIALFTDIVTQIGGEKYSYQVPTYEAIKGALKSVYWKPSFVWIIDRIRVMNEIRTQYIGTKTLSYVDGKTDLSYYTYLYDVRYQVSAHFEWNLNRPELRNDWNENKHHNIAKRMIERGGRRDVFLGSRECQAYVTPCDFGSGVGFYDDRGVIPFGLMLHGHTYPDEAVNASDLGLLTVNLWNAVMKNGIIEFPRPEDCPVRRAIRKMSMKKFSTDLRNFEFTDRGDLDELVSRLD